MMDAIAQKELMDRTRRIETRLTRFMEYMGFDTQSSMPRWDNGVLHVPSVDVSLRHIIMTIPDDFEGVVHVCHKDMALAQVFKQVRQSELSRVSRTDNQGRR